MGHHSDIERCGSAVASGDPDYLHESAALPLDSGVGGPTARGHALHAAALPGLTENDKVMSDWYEACPKNDLHNTLCRHVDGHVRDVMQQIEI